MNSPLLDVRNLSTAFETSRGRVRVLDGVSFSLEEGETLALVGESGCGKSICALSLLQLLPESGIIESGDVFYRGRNMIGLKPRELRKMRGSEIAMVFQEPSHSLNPLWSIGFQVQEAIRAHMNVTRKEARSQAVQRLDEVGIPSPSLRYNDYPHQLSGGMQQRVMLAIALACRPSIVIADEPTTALDVTVQAQILDLLRSLQESYGLAILLITHDFGVVAELADRVAVMYASRLVEVSDAQSLFKHPRHPYTDGLFKSLPPLDRRLDRLAAIPGTVPEPSDYPSGCRFHERCHRAESKCQVESPSLDQKAPGHLASCHFSL